MSPRATKRGAATGLSAWALAAIAFTSALEAVATPRVGVVDQGERVHGALGVGSLELAPRARLEVLPGEHVAFQIAVELDQPVERLALEVGELEAKGGASLVVEAFVEHYVEVRRRSRNAKLADSLAFRDGARPRDADDVGLVPDALVPIALARPWVGPNDRVAAGSRRAFWVEAFVPEQAAPDRYALRARVVHAAGLVGEVEVEIDVLPGRLPYRAARAFAYYERATLERRFAAPDAVERRVWQTLHAHHLDAVTMLLEPADVERVAGALDGSWFGPSAGYHGPGEGASPEVVFFGAYGLLGDPGPATLARVEALEAATRRHHRGGPHLVYAVDEDCASPRGPAWRRLLAARPDLGVGVVHTCHEDPRGQDVDVVMQPAQAFARSPAREARASGREVWVYNGQLPHGPPMMLDVPAAALTLSGWLAAGQDLGRWFFWETIFWDDGNRGGLGPRDVFGDAETFHNADGDTALLDGLLLYPGRGHAPDARSLDVDAVLPSLRLKRLRRGLEDAGLLALATDRLGPDEVAFLVRSIAEAAFDEVDPASPTRLVLDPARHAAVRDRLRRAAVGASLEPAEVDARLDTLRAAVRARPPATYPPAAAVVLGLPLALAALGAVAARLHDALLTRLRR